MHYNCYGTRGWVGTDMVTLRIRLITTAPHLVQADYGYLSTS